MGRAPCCDKANVKKGPWSPEEDAKLKAYIEQHGTGGNWIALPQKIGLKRCGKSCRLRWLNYLRPNIKHGGFTEEEENIICSLYISIGSRWSIIAAQLPGRTDNDIKNYWNTRLKKKLMAKQRKEQAAARAGLLEQEFKREASISISSTAFLANPNLTQMPYWAEQQLGLGFPYGGQFYDVDPQLAVSNGFDYQQCLAQEQLFAGPSDAMAPPSASAAMSANNYIQWLSAEYDVNGAGLSIHQELEAYFTSLLSFEGGESTQSGSGTSTSGGTSAGWGDMSSLVNTPVSSGFEGYQTGLLQKVAQ